MTDRGVEVDVCARCRGLWLDRGEIFSFARDRARLTRALEEARRTATSGALLSPQTGAPMIVLKLLGGQLEIDECPKSGGLWLDRGEIERVGREAGFGVVLDESAEPPEVRPDPALAARLGAVAAGLAPLPNLFLRSATLLMALYGILGAVLIAVVELGGLGPGVALAVGVAFAIVQFAVAPWIMDFSLWVFYRCRSVEPGELPPHLRQFVERVCADRKLKFPRFKIIDDGAPNAFTYGHHPGNARVVITRGILELLDPTTRTPAPEGQAGVLALLPRAA
jgi:Zn-finger nucleic acid-binding protein